MNGSVITDVVVFIPANRIEAFCRKFDIHPGRDSLEFFLWQKGWRAQTGAHQCEVFSPVESRFAHLDLEHDPLLEGLIGIAPTGCFVRGYDDENTQWELRYHADRKEVIEGSVVFPEWSERKWSVGESHAL